MRKIYISFVMFTLIAIISAFTLSDIVVARQTTASTATINASKQNTSNVNRLNEMMLDKINELRASVGVCSLSTNTTLNSYAGTRAVEATIKWSHTRPNGTQGCDMIPASKWRGENLSYVIIPNFSYSEDDQMKAAETMFDNLVASPAHYDNMVFGDFTKIGIRTNVTNVPEGTKLTTAYLFSN